MTLLAWASQSLALFVGCGQSHGKASSPESASPTASEEADDGSPPRDGSESNGESGSSQQPGNGSDVDQSGIPCGPNVCGEGEECCNASCGICVPKGGMCTQQYCE